MRPATPLEKRAWKQLFPDAELGHCFVFESYITDCPGYAGALGLIIWTGSPVWITILTVREGRWQIELDTVKFLEVDPRGAFEFFQGILKNGEETIEEFLDGQANVLSELLDTGSVTVELAGREWEIVINVKELK